MNAANSLKHIGCEIDVSDSTLSSILTALGYTTRTSTFPGIVSDRVMVKFLLAETKNKSRNYMVAFLFDKQNTGKLVRMTMEDIDSVGSWVMLELARIPLSALVLVGKKGSRKDNRFSIMSTPLGQNNLIIRDFTSNDNIQTYISSLLCDIDKIESRRVQDPIRADMAVIQPSDKSIRLLPGMAPDQVQRTVFANQLLQIPGMTEKLALALSERFGNPLGLLQVMETPAALEGFTFLDSRNVEKSRLLSALSRLFSLKADPNSCVW